MKVVIAAVGRPRNPGLREAIRDYEARADRYFRLRVEEVPPEDPSRGPAARGVRLEGEALLRKVPAGADVVALTRTGKGMTSEGLAAYLDRLATYGRAGVAFLVGGAFGLGPGVLERSNYRLSLSPMTLPHEMARLLLAEQIYRAGTILRGEPYHKGSP